MIASFAHPFFEAIALEMVCAFLVSPVNMILGYQIFANRYPYGIHDFSAAALLDALDRKNLASGESSLEANTFDIRFFSRTFEHVDHIEINADGVESFLEEVQNGIGGIAQQTKAIHGR